MPSPDTSAQGVPVAPQEAEAREAVSDAVLALRAARLGIAESIAVSHALDIYADAIRASERERYAALVAAATEVRDLPMLRGESGVGATYTVTYKDTGVSERLEAALAALEEAGSA